MAKRLRYRRFNLPFILILVILAVLALLAGAQYLYFGQNARVSEADTSPANCTQNFSDVPATNVFISYIKCVACNHVMNGYANSTFRPSASVTRAQIAQALFNALHLTNPTSPHQIFADVPTSSNFYDAITQVSARNLMTGFACGGVGEPCNAQNMPYFRPSQNVIRSHLAKFVANAAFHDQIPATQQTFTDVTPSNIFYPYIERLAKRGIVVGYNCGGPGEPCDSRNRAYYRPNNNATREQTAKVFAGTFLQQCLKGL